MIDSALKAVADFVDNHAHTAAWDLHHRPTPEQEAAKAEKIRGVGRELHTLAEAAETRNVRYREYQVLKDRLYGFGFSLPQGLEQSVAVAFHTAEGPVKPRNKGWLKQP